MKPESLMCFDTIRDSSYDLSLKNQFYKEDRGIYSFLDIPTQFNPTPLKIFYEYCCKMSNVQRQFFMEPIGSIQKAFIYCPGGNFRSFFFPKDKESRSLYTEFQNEDKLYILKWIFSALCSAKILIAYQVSPIYIFGDSFLIDSKMNARFFYSKWDKNKIATLSHDSGNYIPPEINDAQYKPDYEKECVYSIGILSIALLNRRIPSNYFTNTVKDEKEREKLKNKIFLENIPNCELAELIKKLISKNPSERPSLMNVIGDLIKEENCLDGVDYSKFRKFIYEKFDVENEVDDSTLINLIENKLSEKCESNNSKIKYDKFTLEDVQDFIDLAKSTSSFGAEIEKQCETIIDSVYSNILCDALKKYFLKKKDGQNKFNVLQYCLLNNYDEFVEPNSEKFLNVFSVDEMIDNDFSDFSFTVKIYTNKREVKFVIPSELRFSIDYAQFLNENDHFVKIDQNQEIEFYPFLNVYSYLNNRSSLNKISIDIKIKWILQIAEALKKLHESKYTIFNFTSKNIFIDSDLDAHLFPAKIVKLDEYKNENKMLKIKTKSNYLISHYAPELFIAGENNLYLANHTEKSIVFSFGIVILELIFNFHPELFLEKVHDSEKVELLRKRRYFNFSKDDRSAKFNDIVNLCVEINPNVRIDIDELQKLLKTTQNTHILTEKKSNENAENDDFASLQSSIDKGSQISLQIFNVLYNMLDLEKKIIYSDYLKAHEHNCNKFKLICSLLDDDNIIVKKVVADKKIEFHHNDVRPDINSNIEFHCDTYSGVYLKEIKRKVLKMCNKPYVKKCHLSGLTETSTRQLILRTSRNLDYNSRQMIDYVVKNKYLQPYGQDLKMKTANQIIDDLIEKNFFENNPKRVKSASGNGNTVLDMEIV